jgi:hypothetical protein
MYENVHEKVKFLTVYILEAHTQDEWPIGDEVLMATQPKTVRIEGVCERVKSIYEVTDGGEMPSCTRIPGRQTVQVASGGGHDEE